MAQSWKSGCWKLWLFSVLAVGGALAQGGDRAKAQIVPDASLGNESSVVTPLDPDFPFDQIDGGATRGANLFHSFERFSILTGRGAFFNNALDIQNIISRVTGASISSIDGLIQANGAANLFLINPNGIIFGPNASLAIGGSFVGSTANSVNFADGTSFSATDPQAPPLLTVNVPLGLQYGGTAGSITNQSRALNSIGGTGLQVQPGKTLSLAGGNVSLAGGIVQAQGGRAELGGLAGAGTVGINGDGSLSFPDGVARADVSLTNGALVNVAAGGDGSIAVNARNLDILGGSGFFAGLGPNLGEVNSSAGNIEINATAKVTIGGASSTGFPSQINNVVNAGTVGMGGNITIQARSLSLEPSAQLATTTVGGIAGESERADAGSIQVNVLDAIAVSGGSVLRSDTFGQGDAGDITLQAGGAVTFDGSAAASTVNFDSQQGLVGVGNGGDITITARSLSLTNGAFLNSSTFGQGDAGSVVLQAEESVSLANSNISSTVESEAQGNAGGINIRTGSLTLTDGAQIQALTRGVGDAGIVSIDASNISFSGVNNGINSGILSNVEFGAQGNAGLIDINAGSLSLTDGAQIQALVREAANGLAGGRGNAGSVNIDVSDTVTLAGSNEQELRSAIFSSVGTGAVGRGGDITLAARSLFLSKGSGLNTFTAGQTGETGQADAGNISVNVSNSVSVSGGSQLRSDTYGEGDAGNVTIEGRDGVVPVVSFDGVEVFNGIPSSSEVVSAVQAAPDVVGDRKGGDITIRARSLFLTNGGQLRADTFGQGDAGDVKVEASDTVSIDGFNVANNFFSRSGIGSTVGRDPQQEGAVGNGQGGDIRIAAGSLSLTNGAALDVSTLGQGNAGDIFVEASDTVSLSKFSVISSTVGSGGIGNGGDIDILARSLSLTGGSQVSAAVFREVGTFPGGEGQGGNIRINASDAVNISGVSSFILPAPAVNPFNTSEPFPTEGFSSGLIANTERGAKGPGGSITVTTGAFRIADGAVVDALTANSGNAGNITINANTFEATGGGQVLTTTRSSGRAGNITLDITGLTLSGSDPTFADRSARFGEDVVNNQGPASGLFANTAQNSTGDGGSIFIDPIQLDITDGAGVAVDSQGTGNGGSLQVQAGSINFDNGAFFSAATASGAGGNIILQVQDLLLMRRNSNISTQAGGTGNGGNIDIDADFIVALPSEDSNIIADAIEGRGGSIDITAQGIFGIQSREQQTSLSDITASSEVGIDGTVEINRPDVDPSQGLVTLPAELVDASNQIAQGCAAAAESVAKNEFIITGRGGLPPSPTEPLNGEAVLTNWATLEPDVENRSSAEETAPSSTRVSAPTTIVEAQGWVIGANGDVVLTATAPTVTPYIPSMNPATCHGSLNFHQQLLALGPD